MNLPPALVLPLDGPGVPFGSASFPDGLGLDLAAAGYAEEEFLLSGTAGIWETGAPGCPRRRDSDIPYRTRVLVRYPVDASRRSGVAHVEPLHPHMDAGLSWDALAHHFIRRGDVWVGVTVYPHIAAAMRERIDPTRYRALLVPGLGTEWDIFSDALTAIRDGELPPVHEERVVVSGWSATGSFCRVFARERFAVARGALADAVAIFISSGGAGAAGHPPLSPEDARIDGGDPRRTVRDAGVPVFEILSETESETHRDQLRPDSDDPGDTYRLYQIAGSAHVENWPGVRSGNASMLAAAGIDVGRTAVREPLTDARSDLIARALIDHLVAAAAGTAAPRTARFEYEEGDVPHARMLRRDADGNVLGGIRSPWVEAPLSVYSPHGTPAASYEAGPGWTPLADRDLAASLIGTMRTLPADDILRRYTNEPGYERLFATATRELVDRGLLLTEDATELERTAAERWTAAVGTERRDA